MMVSNLELLELMAKPKYMPSLVTKQADRV
jgi:hypothetical protein